MCIIVKLIKKLTFYFVFYTAHVAHFWITLGVGTEYPTSQATLPWSVLGTLTRMP